LIRPVRSRLAPALALATTLLSSCAARAAPQVGAATVPLTDYGGRPVVAVTIDDHGPFPFILDTGAQVTVIDLALAEELGLPQTGSMPLGAPGSKHQAMAPVYSAPSVTAGDLVLPAEGLVGMDLTLFPEGAGRPRGVLGFWLLGGGVATLDMSGRRFTLDPGASLTEGEDGAMPLRRSGAYPEFEVSIAGRTLEAHLDTGSPSVLTFPKEWQERIPLLAPPVLSDKKARMTGEERDMYVAILDGDATIGGVTLRNPEIKFMERIPGVNVGSALIRDALVQIDLSNRLIRLAPQAPQAPRVPLGPEGR